MSYSFTVRAATKAEAKERVDAELAKVVSTQPIHSRDRAQVQRAAEAFIDLIEDDDARDVAVTVNGSVGWSAPITAGSEGSHPLTAASLGITAHLATREASS